MAAIGDSALTDLDSATGDLVPCEQRDVSLALKITPTSNDIEHAVSIVHQLLCRYLDFISSTP